MKKYELAIKEYSSCAECGNCDLGKCAHPSLDKPTIILIRKGESFPDFCPLDDCDADQS